MEDGIKSTNIANEKPYRKSIVGGEEAREEKTSIELVFDLIRDANPVIISYLLQAMLPTLSVYFLAHQVSAEYQCLPLPPPLC